MQGHHTFVKETLLKLKTHNEPFTLLVGHINIPLSQIDRSLKQKIKRDTVKLIKVINHVNLTDIYRTIHPKMLHPLQ